MSLIQGYECNITVSAGDDGIVMVDTCGAEGAEQLLAAVKRLSEKPFRFVINTHAHGDHTGANMFFQNFAPVVAHHNVRKRMAAGNEKTGDKPRAPEALPAVTFDSEMILHLNGEEIRLLYLPPGHTDGDVVVFFQKANVVCMGDEFISPAVSFGDRHYGGSMLGLIAALEFLSADSRGRKIVPGHGRFRRAPTSRVVSRYEADEGRGRSRCKEGKTLEQNPGARGPSTSGAAQFPMVFVRQVARPVGEGFLPRDDRPEPAQPPPKVPDSACDALQELLVRGQVLHHAGDRGLGVFSVCRSARSRGFRRAAMPHAAGSPCLRTPTASSKRGTIRPRPRASRHAP